MKTKPATGETYPKSDLFNKAGARLSTSRVMAITFIFMSVLIVLSLAVNVIQGINNYRLQNEQRTAVTPMGFNVP
ncbi:TraE/TraK family type IV conjugative transfer system protein, partial [Escherichia coli]